MNDALAMNIFQRVGDPGAEIGDFADGQRQLRQPVEQRAAGDQLHDHIGTVEIARRDKRRHVTAGEPRHDHLFGFVADDGERVLAGQQERQLHHQRRGDIGARDTFHSVPMPP